MINVTKTVVLRDDDFGYVFCLPRLRFERFLLEEACFRKYTNSITSATTPYQSKKLITKVNWPQASLRIY